MGEIIRPPEFNRPNLKSVLEKAEALFIEYKLTPPQNIDTSGTNRFAVEEEGPTRIAELLEHHLIQFKSAVETQPEKLQEIIEGSSILWLCFDRAKKLGSNED